MLIAHGPISYLLNEKIQGKDIKKTEGNTRILISILSLFFGILPDFDMFILVMQHLPTFLHHSIITHSLTFWVLSWIVLKIFFLFLGKNVNVKKNHLFNKNILSIIEKSFLIGTVSHILVDSVFTHVRLLYPLENQFTLLGNLVESNLFTGYLYSTSMALEMVIIVFLLFYIYKNFFKSNTSITYITYVLTVISISYLLFSTYVTFNTYNVSTHTLDDRRMNDADFDMVSDTKDFDTDNNFINNIDDSNPNMLAQDVTKIINSHTLVSTRKNISQELYYRLGAFNSYRLVSQAYFEQNKSLEPVLEEYARTKYGIQGYDLDLKYPELLFIYFKEKDTLIGLNTIQSESVPTGKILFVNDTNGNVINLGIILEDDMVGIVLDTDKRLQVHSISEIQKLYGNDFELYIQI